MSLALVFAPCQAIQIRPLTSACSDVRIHRQRGWEARSVFETAKYLHRPLPFRWLRLHLRGTLLCFRLDEFMKARRSLAAKRPEKPGPKRHIYHLRSMCQARGLLSHRYNFETMGGQEAFQCFHVPPQEVIRR